MFAEFAPDPDMQLFVRGIRRRLAPMLGGDRRRIELAYSLLYSLPGAPVLYYGEEIGMGEDLSLPERWPVRTPMQWTDGPNAGFSAAKPEQLIHPALEGGPFGAHAVNVTAQHRDPGSLLNWMRRLNAVRSSCPEVGSGDLHVVETDEPAVFAHSYRHDDRLLVFLHNLDDVPVSVDLRRSMAEAGPLVDLFGNQVYQPPESGPMAIELDGFGYRWPRRNPRPR